MLSSNFKKIIFINSIPLWNKNENKHISCNASLLLSRKNHNIPSFFSTLTTNYAEAISELGNSLHEKQCLCKFPQTKFLVANNHDNT